MIHWVGIGIAFGIGFALSSQTIYWALRRTPLHKESTRRIAREMVVEINKETASRIKAGGSLR